MMNNSSTVFEGLNEAQRNAVSCTEGPVLIVAGAGSGKTRVLTSRIAYLLELGVEARRILALTFTKKAAGEMKDRIAGMVGPEKARRLVMGTFHAVFVRFLREFAADLGYPESFTIYDQSDSTSAVKACIKELGLDDKVYKPKEILARISKAKNNLVTADAYRNNPGIVASDTRSRKPRLCDVYSLYAQKCRQSGVMDFDDILLNMNILLRDFPAARESVSARFSYILVDEYQDTNYAQYLILKRLAEPHHNLCVVGDDSQSIFAFRGAKIENILNFKKDYPECRLFRLERNYRSTRNIVDAANSLIAKNDGRIPKTCYSEAEAGETIKIISAWNEQEEAQLIVSDILERMRTQKAQYQDFAVLYRTNAQSRALEEALRRRNIPYHIFSGNSFFERAEIKDMMAWFKLAVNPDDDESFKRAVGKPSRGIGGTTMDALAQAARAARTSLYRAATAPGLENFGLRGAAILRLQEFCKLVGGFAAEQGGTDAHALSLSIAEKSGLWAMYKEDVTIEGLSRTANLEELLNSVAGYVEEVLEDAEGVEEAPLVRLADYLENVSLMSNVDAGDDEDASNKVALMTAHTAKGLEFPHVTVAGLEENLFPSGGMLALPTDIEEERRLFYVAMTRAKKTVTLTFAQTRMRNGRHESNEPSRFLREIDPQYLKNPLGSREKPEIAAGPTFGRPMTTRVYGRAPQASAPVYHGKASVLQRPLPDKIPDSDFVPTPPEQLRAGQRVEHNRFGGGKILEITGTAPEWKARIVFDGYGEKLIMLKYAKLRLEK